MNLLVISGSTPRSSLDTRLAHLVGEVRPTTWPAQCLDQVTEPADPGLARAS